MLLTNLAKSFQAFQEIQPAENSFTQCSANTNRIRPDSISTRLFTALQLSIKCRPIRLTDPHSASNFRIRPVPLDFIGLEHWEKFTVNHWYHQIIWFKLLGFIRSNLSDWRSARLPWERAWFARLFATSKLNWAILNNKCYFKPFQINSKRSSSYFGEQNDFRKYWIRLTDTQSLIHSVYYTEAACRLDSARIINLEPTNLEWDYLNGTEFDNQIQFLPFPLFSFSLIHCLILHLWTTRRCSGRLTDVAQQSTVIWHHRDDAQSIHILTIMRSSEPI